MTEFLLLYELFLSGHLYVESNPSHNSTQHVSLRLSHAALNYFCQINNWEMMGVWVRVDNNYILHRSLCCILLNMGISHANSSKRCQGQAVVLSCFCSVRMIWLAVGGEGDISINLLWERRVELIKGGGATQLRYCWLNSSLLCIIFSSITNARIQKLWRLERSFCPLDGRSIWIISSPFDVSCCLEEEERRKKLLGNKTLLLLRLKCIIAKTVSAPQYPNKKNQILQFKCMQYVFLV